MSIASLSRRLQSLAGCIGIFLVLMADGFGGYILPCGLCMYAVSS